MFANNFCPLKTHAFVNVIYLENNVLFNFEIELILNYITLQDILCPHKLCKEKCT